ncbi:hypothetical protein GCM10007175_16620 [Pseudarthrobacter scleromae]|uniref:Uncharacterized protein n=1 Tax=Pseudarthrobacter scleromae TaxID=158897 RepID=A0ABQ2CEB1_9MICC|nr:hypothetical protein GCM10007175_16620 [Pseudarthrobacter scleromae]
MSWAAGSTVAIRGDSGCCDMCTNLSLVTVTSLKITTWTLTGFTGVLFAQPRLFADGARSAGKVRQRPDFNAKGPRIV